MAIPSIANNTPSAGHISWGAFVVKYMGGSYAVGAGSTSSRWVWWRYNAGAPSLEAGADIPTNLTDDDLLLFRNNSGVGLRVQSNNLIDGELLVDGSVFADAIATNQINSQHVVTMGLDAGVIKFGSMSGDRIAANSLNADRIVAGSLTIGSVTGLQSKFDAFDSRGSDLITNGTGAMRNNTNFSEFTFDAVDAPTGSAGSFVTNLGERAVKNLDEYIPIDPTRRYRFSFMARQSGTSTNSGLYSYFFPVDAYKRDILPDMYMYALNTLTTLSAPLNVGDTTVQLTNAANWYGSSAKPAGADTHYRKIIWWDYVDPGGKVWPPETYSRNFTPSNSWLDGSVSGNTITLRVPYAGPAKPAGTKLSNGSSGGTYMYMNNNAIPSQGWTRYSGDMTPKVITNGQGASFATGWPISVAYAKVGFLANYTGDFANSRHKFANISVSDAAASQAIVDSWTYPGSTTINGGSIQTNTIKADQIDALAINAKHTITGALIQSSSETNKGIKFNNNALVAFNASGSPTFAITAATGDVSMLGNLTSGSTITGSTITGGLFQTTASASRGIKIDSSAFKAYSDAGAETFSINATTGAVTMVGNLTSGSIITGAEFNGGIIRANNTQIGTGWPYHINMGAVLLDGQQRATIEFNKDFAVLGRMYASSDVDEETGLANETVRLRAGDGTYFSAKLILEGQGSRVLVKDHIVASPYQDRRFGVYASVGGAARRYVFRAESDGSLWAPLLATNSGGSALRVGSSGQIFKDSSSEKYKVAIDSMSSDHLQKFLDLDVKTWHDLPNSERYFDYCETGDEEKLETVEPFRRIPGLIAEEVEALGLKEFVLYSDSGEVEGLAYDRIGVSWIPLVKQLWDRVAQLEATINNV